MNQADKEILNIFAILVSIVMSMGPIGVIIMFLNNRRCIEYTVNGETKVYRRASEVQVKFREGKNWQTLKPGDVRGPGLLRIWRCWIATDGTSSPAHLDKECTVESVRWT